MRRVSGKFENDRFEIDGYKGKRLPSLQWEIRRDLDDLLMGVFDNRTQALGYTVEKALADARPQ